jgi:beta-1,4-mannosyl-glycoprotein beta-1,4-N-acetylglucosaminyltransferase
MIYDCFTFFNELDLLEIRLNVLNDVVDKFVLVEATKAHSGKDKPLYFSEHKERYKAFQDKIIHVIVDDYPECTSPWAYENHQRNAILRGLTHAHPDDAIIISDLDEIPEPNLVRLHAQTKEAVLFIQKLFYYYLNYLNVSNPDWPLGSKLFPYSYFMGDDSRFSFSYSEFLIPEINKGVTPTKIRFLENLKVIRNAGWHFSYLGGTEAIIKKIQSTAHQEFNKEKHTDPKEILQQVRAGKDIFGRGDRFFALPIDEQFPLFMRDNQSRYQHLIFDASADYLRKTWFARRYYGCKGKLYRFIVFRMIPRSLHPLLLKIRNLLWFGRTSVPKTKVELSKSER